MIPSPRKWTAEPPDLYPLLLSLEENGKITQVTGTEFGFPELEIKEGILLLNGKPSKSGMISLPSVAPRESAVIDNPVAVEQLPGNSEWLLNVSLRLKKDELWAKKKAPVVKEQLIIQPHDFEKKEMHSNHKLTMRKDGNMTELFNDRFSVRINHNTGWIEDYRMDGHILMKRGPKLNFWRPPTDNDGLYGKAVKPRGGRRIIAEWLQNNLDKLSYLVQSVDLWNCLKGWTSCCLCR